MAAEPGMMIGVNITLLEKGRRNNGYSTCSFFQGHSEMLKLKEYCNVKGIRVAFQFPLYKGILCKHYQSPKKRLA